MISYATELLSTNSFAEWDRKAIPAVNRDHRQRQVNDLLFGEVMAEFLKLRIVDMSFGNASLLRVRFCYAGQDNTHIH